MDHGISELDLQAYVDDQLDPHRRIEVEAYLQANPTAAARVMEDLRRRDEIRLFLAEPSGPPAERTAELARQLGWRLRLASVAPQLRRALVAAMFLGAGWFAHAQFGNLLVPSVVAANVPPSFVDEAAEAHQTVVMELAVSSALLSNDAAKFAESAAAGAGNRIPMPAFGNAAMTVGSHLVPWDGGTAVQLIYRLPDDDAYMTLFAAEADEANSVDPIGAIVDGLGVAYWQSGPYVYVLIGNRPLDDLLSFAQ